ATYVLTICALWIRACGIFGKSIIEGVGASSRPRPRGGPGGWGVGRPVPAASPADLARPGGAQPRRAMRARAAWSTHPPPSRAPAWRARGVAHDSPRVRGAQDDVRGRHGTVSLAHSPLDGRGACTPISPRA